MCAEVSTVELSIGTQSRIAEEQIHLKNYRTSPAVHSIHKRLERGVPFLEVALYQNDFHLVST